MATTLPTSDLLQKLYGYRLSMAISVAATLRIADLLHDGPRSSDELAAKTGTHAPSLYRLLRALAAEGIFEERPDRAFAQTPLSELLRTDAPGSLHAWAEFIARPASWQAWGRLMHSVRTGESAVAEVVGMDTWAYRAQHPEEQAYFDRAMTAMTRALSPAVVAAVDWGKFGVIADIAGGHGAQLADILARFPGTRGILFDQPQVVAGSDAILRDAGVSDRCEVVGGSFFDQVPAADAYILKHILHDWGDGDCARILQVIRGAAPAHARLFVIERLIGRRNEGAADTSSDLNMLVGPGGQERTREEYEALLASGGWTLVAAHAAETRYVLESTIA